MNGPPEVPITPEDWEKTPASVQAVILGFIPYSWVDFGLLLLLGLENGSSAVLSITWIQTRTPKEMLGRMMSLLILSSTGLIPISQAIAGALSKWNLTVAFALPVC